MLFARGHVMFANSRSVHAAWTLMSLVSIPLRGSDDHLHAWCIDGIPFAPKKSSDRLDQIFVSAAGGG